jgi:hypothetical protein
MTSIDTLQEICATYDTSSEGQTKEEILMYIKLYYPFSSDTGVGEALLRNIIDRVELDQRQLEYINNLINIGQAENKYFVMSALDLLDYEQLVAIGW